MWIFKRQWSKESFSKCWYSEFKDQMDILRIIKLFSDKRASEEAGRNIERLVDFKQAARALDAGLLAFVEGLPTDQRSNLAEWGLLDRGQAATGMPLMTVKRSKTHNNKTKITITGGHLLDYENSLKARELAPKHILQVVNHCLKIIEGCGYIFPSSINAAQTENFLRGIREQNKSARTVNTFLQAFKSFCTWLEGEGRLSGEPVKRLDLLNEQSDKRYERGAMTEAEINALLTETAKADAHHGLSGFERRMVYQLAIETGLRWNEIYTLKRASFNLTGGYSVTVSAGNAKNKKTDALPLSPELAADIATYFDMNPALPLAKAFNGMWKNRGADMLNEDLLAAGVEAVDDTGRILDFHSLRHTCGTRLAKSGCSPQIAQKIMRHSTMEMTLRYYTHLSLENKAEALAKLPAIHAQQAESLTGTDNILNTSAGNRMENRLFRGANAGVLSHGVAFCKHGIAEYASGKEKPQTLDLQGVCGTGITGISMGIRTPVVSVKS